MEEVADIEKRLTGREGASHLDDIQRLYDLCEAPELRVVAEALKAIPRVLSHRRQLARAELSADAAPSESASNWLRQQTKTYHSILMKLAVKKDPHAQVCAIRLTMASLQIEEAELQAARIRSQPRGGSMLRPEAAQLRIEGLLTQLLVSEHWSKHAAQCLTAEFLAPFADVRHYILQHLRTVLLQVGKAKSIRNCAAGNAGAAPPAKRLKQEAPFAELIRSRGLPPDDLFSRVFEILREVPQPGPNNSIAQHFDGDLPEVQMLAPGEQTKNSVLKSYRRLFQDVWLQLLNLRVPLDRCRALLQFVPNHVMPHMQEPLLLADFYLRAFQSESTELSVLSLSGLFLLLTRYSLGDPETLSSSSSQYYVQLYSLVKPESFKLRQRARFQRLLATSLASGLLPARYAAAFAKKCMSVAVVSPDAGTTMWLVSISYSLIQRHHSHCKYLLHSVATENGKTEHAEAPNGRLLAHDPFDAEAPLMTALEQMAKTSLWEVKLLERHHVPAVALLLKLFNKPFFKPSAKKLDPESFLDQSAAKVFQQALRAGERQASKWTARGEKCPLAFKVEDDELALRIAGWAAALSTSQRRIGAGI
mmetsp:Transcript_75633/g.130986  ORF Transcript_75633/g.130986 Transcript_75633/m.130986 type:complete len:591 (-) Transcript_75633:47-1819(-)